MGKKRYSQEIASRMKKNYPSPRTELEYENEMQLFIAVLLSSQTTDTKVNEVTGSLFSKYESWADIAEADEEELEKDLYGVNFHKTKARRVKKCAQLIEDRFGGEVPDNMEDLTSLPGIARKSANVILQELWDIAEGIVVDTHVSRVSKRLGLVDTDNAKKIERKLMDLIPKSYWRNFSGAMVLHGRYICVARKPKCSECFLNDICPSSRV